MWVQTGDAPTFAMGAWLLLVTTYLAAVTYLAGPLYPPELCWGRGIQTGAVGIGAIEVRRPVLQIRIRRVSGDLRRSHFLIWHTPCN